MHWPESKWCICIIWLFEIPGASSSWVVKEPPIWINHSLPVAGRSERCLHLPRKKHFRYIYQSRRTKVSSGQGDESLLVSPAFLPWALHRESDNHHCDFPALSHHVPLHCSFMKWGCAHCCSHDCRSIANMVNVRGCGVLSKDIHGRGLGDSRVPNGTPGSLACDPYVTYM